jgi:hypothetical protein
VTPADGRAQKAVAPAQVEHPARARRDRHHPSEDAGRRPREPEHRALVGVPIGCLERELVKVNSGARPQDVLKVLDQLPLHVVRFHVGPHIERGPGKERPPSQPGDTVVGGADRFDVTHRHQQPEEHVEGLRVQAETTRQLGCVVRAIRHGFDDTKSDGGHQGARLHERRQAIDDRKRHFAGKQTHSLAKRARDDTVAHQVSRRFTAGLLLLMGR